ncbi:hypothetical protein PCANC_19421 [Puccinia coronata f. sp. avenae]|uniref:RRM domain-containing protein n=1 Tax=Puccinia coronata f. sp. avenae TaxID=200324 RepID=A0A2N5V176_9BASI|nr:hypothetical protein PCANC_19421 [Puccinia coronata f. sp. avenae]
MQSSIRYPPQPYVLLPSQLQPGANQQAHHPPLPQDSRTQLFVNNLPFRVRWQDLKDLFRKAGTVLRADVSLTPDNRSKGFGTVLFANRNDAFKAVEIYNGFSWQTRILDVRLDQQDPTGAFGMAAAVAAAATCSIPPPQQPLPHHQQQYYHLQQSHQQPIQHLQQYHQQQPHHHHPQLAVPHHTNNHLAHSQNSLLPQPAGNPSNAYHHNRSAPAGGNTTAIGDPHLVSSSSAPPHQALPQAHPSNANMSAPSSSSFTAGQPSNSQQSLATTSINHKPVHSFQKHQHSQSLIPFPDPSSNPSQSAFNPLLKTSTHRPSRSVQLSHSQSPVQLADSSSSSATTPSQTPPSRTLDVHQPVFRPAASSLNQPLAHLHISAPPSSLPSVTISTALPDSSSISPAPVDPSSSPASSPAGSVPHANSAGTRSQSSSLIGSSSSLNGSLIHPHPSLSSLHHYGSSHSYPPHHMAGANLNHAPYPNLHGQNPGSACRLLFVGNLPFNLQWQDLKDLFRQAGNILRADVAMTGEGRSRGYGTVLFSTAEDAMKAVDMYDGYELKGRALKVRFDNAFASSGTAATTTHDPPSSWPDMIPGLPPPNSHPIHPGQPHSDRPMIQDPTQHSERIEANSVYSSSASVDQDKPNESRSDLWAPDPVRPTVRVSVPTIVPPALSPIASRRSSYFKSNNNGTSEYSQTSSDGGQGTSSQSGTGPEPIGHPTSSQPRPQTIPMPPRYAPGLVSPALPKTIQMTPSMPAFSFQPFMPATPPLLPNFFSPGIGPPPTPPYGRDGNNHTPPPCPAKPPVHSPLAYNPMFPTEAETEDGGSTDESEGRLNKGHHHKHDTADNDEEEEEEGSDAPVAETKRINSNVDWGYQQSTLSSSSSSAATANRRTSLFVTRPGAPGAGLSPGRLPAPHAGGFAARRLLGLGEEDSLDEDFGADGASRRASFDVSSLSNSHHHHHSSPPPKLQKLRPSNIIISAADNDLPSTKTTITAAAAAAKPADHPRIVSLPVLPPHSLDQSNLAKERVDLVGLGFVDSIWTDKQ